jgi:RNA polymerase sigma factor (sigma-70 family)
VIHVEFETTFDEIYPALFRYCHRLTGDPDVAEDFAQEAFVRLYEGAVSGTVDGLRVWLFRTATNLVRDRYRVDTNRERLLKANPVRPAEAERPDRGLERGEKVARVRRALAVLSARDQEILLMRYEGFSYREIADTVEVAASSVGTLLARAEARFADAYEGNEENDDAPR